MPFPTPIMTVALRRILLATDFSAFSEKPLRFALAVAHRYGAKLYLVNVASQPRLTHLSSSMTEDAMQSAWREARHLETSLLVDGSLQDLTYDVLVRRGEVWEELEQIVEQEHVDLIVIGTHGRTGIRKLVLGSVAEQVFRHASCPVLTVGPHAPEDSQLQSDLGHVLYPTDLSSESAQAAEYALSVAGMHHARLTVLHVLELLEGEALADRERVISVVEERLRQFLPNQDLPYNLNNRVLVGPIEETILRFAKDFDVGLIVLGLRPPDSYVNHLVWLHAYEIIRRACCPVLTVRSGGTRSPTQKG